MNKSLGGFETYGVTFVGKSGNQTYGNCPLCGKDGKFYVNVDSLLWDCKKCGAHGNVSGFLQAVYEKSVQDADESFLNKLAIDRGLPLKALKPWGFGRYKDRYTLPVYNETGHMQDLRTYTSALKMRSTPGCQVGLLGLPNLLASDEKVPVYVCEGEWDGIALQWLLNFLKEPGVTVAVPGANTFKREWSGYFRGRNVICCYDNDDAGRSGSLVAQDRLTGVAKSLSFLHWDEDLEDGYDVRDLIRFKAIKDQKPRLTYIHLRDRLKPTPKGVKLEEPVQVDPLSVAGLPPKKVTIDDVHKVFKKWLFLKDLSGIDISLATIISNEMEGDPLWMFLVSAPGGAKTEILQACSKCTNVYATSSLTSHALISGANFVNGKDPSVLPHLHGKTLIIKDFTTILTKREQEKEEIFGIFRDAYDGNSGKVFGNGQRREYISHFSILAAVTPKVYEMAAEHQSFGERFLKFVVGDNLHHKFEEDMIAQAISNVGSEDTMRPELCKVVQEFMAYAVYQTKQYNPTIPDSIKTKIIALAMFGARMRGTVSHDKYRTDIMLSKPSAEYGTRLSKQISKTLKALAYLYGKKEVTMNEYRLVCRVILNTVSQKIEDVVSTLLSGTLTIDDTLTTRDLAVKTKYTLSTISQVLGDLDILGVVRKSGKTNAYEWTVSEYIRNLVKRSEVYDGK